MRVSFDSIEWCNQADIDPRFFTKKVLLINRNRKHGGSARTVSVPMLLFFFVGKKTLNARIGMECINVGLEW